MTGATTDRPTTHRPATDAPGRPSTLVWIDSREAVIVRWQDGSASIRRVASAVPAHHRATGHVRHDPTCRHGGGGSPQTAGEPHRIEHLKQFLATTADLLDAGDDLLILGPGVVHERLERSIRDADVEHGRHRTIASEDAAAATDRQLVARLRRFAGVPSRRRTVGAYRWTGLPAPAAADAFEPRPRRVVVKPRREEDVEG